MDRPNTIVRRLGMNADQKKTSSAMSTHGGEMGIEKQERILEITKRPSHSYVFPERAVDGGTR